MDDSATRLRRRTGEFIATKEHRRFVEFANAVRREAFIGLCFGPAGVGKTLSARRYAHWDAAEEFFDDWGVRRDEERQIGASLARSRTIFYTPAVKVTYAKLVADLDQLLIRADILIDDQVREGIVVSRGRRLHHVQLIVIDEAERLSGPALEDLRDRFDRRPIGLLLIGMPGLEKRFAAFPQLYSRIGFAHQYRPLTDEELAFVLARHWRRLGLTLDLDDFTDAQAIAAISRITRGNFRLLHRLFTQVARIMKINDLTVITTDVIEAARSTLVIGTE
ncbi:AAA family ATPase [Patulibacter minatonensis]|uniref:AAA family ATPase n=1 Tax=Patulibacter minatonensis TaxID=298163 RepID=UPI0004B793B5|nr:AAA family ATPase [Patulibacter minatonensis]